MAGFNERGFALARYRPDGSRNRSFSHDGKVTTDFNSRYDGANSVAIDPRRRIVAAGYARGHVALARYHGSTGPRSRTGRSRSGTWAPLRYPLARRKSITSWAQRSGSSSKRKWRTPSSNTSLEPGICLAKRDA